MTLIERMCREMCQADGFDPEMVVSEHKIPSIIGPRGHECQMERSYVEAWWLYVPLAKAAIAVLNKAQITEE